MSGSRPDDAGADPKVIAPMQDNHARRPPRPECRAAATVSAIAPIDGAAAMFPAGYPLRQAAFVRRGDHLVVRAAGHADVVVPSFFGTGGQTTLVTRDGMEMSRHMVLLMLNISHRVERALTALVVPGGRDA